MPEFGRKSSSQLKNETSGTKYFDCFERKTHKQDLFLYANYDERLLENCRFDECLFNREKKHVAIISYDGYFIYSGWAGKAFFECGCGLYLSADGLCIIAKLEKYKRINLIIVNILINHHGCVRFFDVNYSGCAIIDYVSLS